MEIVLCFRWDAEEAVCGYSVCRGLKNRHLRRAHSRSGPLRPPGYLGTAVEIQTRYGKGGKNQGSAKGFETLQVCRIGLYSHLCMFDPFQDEKLTKTELKFKVDLKYIQYESC